MSNYDYANGVIAVKEQSFITDKIYRATELDAEEAFKLIAENTETTAMGAGDYKKFVQEREDKLLSFIDEYAVKQDVRAFFLLAYDYENLKAIIKARAIGEDPTDFITRNGLYSAEDLIADYNAEKLPAFMQECVSAVKEIESPSGAEIGVIVTDFYYKDLLKRVKDKSAREIIKERATLTNLITLLKLGSYEKAEPYFISAGLPKSDFKRLGDNGYEVENPLKKYDDIVSAFKRQGVGEAEKLADIKEISYLSERKYVLSEKQPLLWYALRKKIENKNLGILFSCLLKGMSGDEIKQRLRFW